MEKKTFRLSDLLPPPPWIGPPLPRTLGQGWPWRSTTACDSCRADPAPLDVEDADIIALHQEGKSPTEIGARLNVSPGVVRYRLGRAGLPPVLSPWFAKGQKDRSDVIRLHQQGYSPKQIAQELKLNLSRTYRYLREAELEPEASAEELESTVQAFDEILRLGKEGIPRHKIAKRFGSTWHLVATALDKAGVRPVAPACQEIKAWASSLLPVIHEIRRAHPDTLPIVAKVDTLESELVALTEAAKSAEATLPWRGTQADQERWCLGDESYLAHRSLELLDALRGCLRSMDIAKLPRLLEQAESCVANITRLLNLSLSEMAKQ